LKYFQTHENFFEKISDHDHLAEKCKNLKLLYCQISGNKD